MSVSKIFASSKNVLPAFSCVAVLLAAGSVRAQEDGKALAVSLGEVLGSEDFCGLKYDQGAVKTFMDKHVHKDDAEFSETLRMVTGWTHYRNGIMPDSDKPAECAAIERVARSYGFIQ